LKAQARASYNGSLLKNESYKFVAEYVERQRLAKVGFTSDLSRLPSHKAEAFLLISTVFDKEAEKEMKRKK